MENEEASFPLPKQVLRASSENMTLLLFDFLYPFSCICLVIIFQTHPHPLYCVVEIQEPSTKHMF